MFKKKYILFISLIVLNLFYSSIVIVTKYTSSVDFFTVPFLFGIGIIIVMLGIYAVLWQQILKKIELSTAYMFKGLGVVFVLLFSSLVFKEVITTSNIIGSIFIISGIIISAKA